VFSWKNNHDFFRYFKRNATVKTLLSCWSLRFPKIECFVWISFCLQAVLYANVCGREISTVVSTSELSITNGQVYLSSCFRGLLQSFRKKHYVQIRSWLIQRIGVLSPVPVFYHFAFVSLSRYPFDTFVKCWIETLVLSAKRCLVQGFFKENVRYPVWICRDSISLILGTWFSLILGTWW